MTQKSRLKKCTINNDNMQKNTGAKTVRAKQEFLFFVKIIEGIITIITGVKV